MTVWDKVKKSGKWFLIGFASGFASSVVLRALGNADPDIDAARDAERVTRADVDRSVAELRDIVGDIGTGVHVSQQRLEGAERAADTIERGSELIGKGIDGVRDATRQLRRILERAEAGDRCPYCGAVCGDIGSTE